MSWNAAGCAGKPFTLSIMPPTLHDLQALLLPGADNTADQPILQRHPP